MVPTHFFFLDPRFQCLVIGTSPRENPGAQISLQKQVAKVIAKSLLPSQWALYL